MLISYLLVIWQFMVVSIIYVFRVRCDIYRSQVSNKKLS